MVADIMESSSARSPSCSSSSSSPPSFFRSPSRSLPCTFENSILTSNFPSKPSSRGGLLRRSLQAAALLLAAPATVGAVTFEGELPREKEFGVYVGKFCFDYNRTGWLVGYANVQLQAIGATGRMKKPGFVYWVSFDDEDYHWTFARRNSAFSNCSEAKQAHARGKGFQRLTFDGKTQAVDLTVNYNEHIRPRFWYFGFVMCDSDLAPAYPIRYSVHVTNLLEGPEKELSLDHVGLLLTYKIFAVLTLLAALATYRAVNRREDVRLRDHPYVQLLGLAFAASESSCLLFLVHYYFLSKEGFVFLRIRFLAVFAGVVANCAIYLIAILSSFGWAISVSALPYRRTFLSMVLLVGGLHAWSELRAEISLDQSTALYSYQGTSGSLSLVLKLFMFCWFGFQVKTSWQEEVDIVKRRFYRFLGIGLGAWAINIPITVILAFQLAPWVRYKVVTIVDLCVRFLGLLLLAQLFTGPISPLSQENTFNLARLDQELCD